jgi:Tol biopolymer transport system component/Tfp pilus assembly protein PilF
MTQDPDWLSDETPIPPDPAPDPPLPPPKGRPRRHAKLAPAALVLPLLLVGLALYLLATGSPGRPEPGGSATLSPTAMLVTPAVRVTAATVRATPLPTPSNPEEFSEQLAEAESLALQSKFEEAIAIYDALAQQAPDDARPEIGWAWALILDGLPDQALLHARQAVQLDPLRAETMAVWARAYVDLGEKAAALETAQNAVQLDGQSALSRAVLAEAYLLDGQVEKAVEQADLALALDPVNPEAHRIRGWLYYLVDQDLEQATRELQTAAELQPRLWLRHHDLGQLLLAAQDPRAALESLDNALALRPKATTYIAAGNAYYQLGQYDQARRSLQQALSAGAKDEDTYALSSAIDARQDRCDEARPFYEQALALDPASMLALEARDLCLRASSGSPTPTQTEAPTAAPALSGRIAFPAWNSETAQYDTYVARVDGSQRSLVVEEMHQPALSPDGQWLAVNGERPLHMNLFLVRPDGSEMSEITEYVEDGLPCWSPDSRSLVFSSTRHGDKRSRVYIIDEVPFGQGKATGRPLVSDLYEVLGEYPAWTPDGQIVYAGCDYTVTPARCGLFTMSAEPGLQQPTQLTTHPQDTAPAASGSQVAFMSNHDGNWEIYVVNRDGTGLRRLTHNAANDGLPTWSPDGETLAFVSDEGGSWAVWAIDVDGANRRKLFDIGGGGLALDWQHERISWGP